MPDAGRFLIRRWADGCAVFDQTSGDTHALDSASSAGFAADRQGQSALAAIDAALRGQWPEKNDEEIALLAADCLERLEACGLIRAEA
ncbi:MAG: HPr-rel-A system PqqD family peptide chaperone [Azonexus sp.]|jgi:PqqD family protein of HPr-rel-A system|nr:HPr-rel-A system PqqD family peptide chaperone [Azonexus sp.]